MKLAGSVASLESACKGKRWDETSLICSEWLAWEMSSEIGIQLKNGKVFVRRTFARKYGGIDLAWTVRDCDGTDFGSQPGLVEQAKRLLFRAKSMRDLQALLMTHTSSGASLQQVQHAFHLMCWLIPCTEERIELPTLLVEQQCNKDQGKPLKGFSGVSACSVWGDLPSILRTSILNWMDGKYIAESGGRGYKVSEHDTTQKLYHDQQMEAWGEISMKLMQEALDKLIESARPKPQR